MSSKSAGGANTLSLPLTIFWLIFLPATVAGDGPRHPSQDADPFCLSPHSLALFMTRPDPPSH
ncbi:hypothetical protein GALMADRAFT_809888 [Galerina marginata CBS 339.88]|uniref:Uncharacterized protein n=1 Tax=Galerina marginata (strain CBS 339.88) TaxID=685588 RepID=A0A067SIP7_GALM3|nr:hypothetical protein GALMADRAFT_809888 [Galerina marginata CBS 339.88]